MWCVVSVCCACVPACLFACADSGMYLKHERLSDHFCTSGDKPLKNVEIFPEGLSVTCVKGKRCQTE